jgi:hypothetical protein
MKSDAAYSYRQGTMNDVITLKRGISSVGRAPALQAGGRRFDPVILHHRIKYLIDTKLLLAYALRARNS